MAGGGDVCVVLLECQHHLNWPIVYLNIPICAVAFVTLFLSLRGVDLKASETTSWQSFKRQFDFIGL